MPETLRVFREELQSSQADETAQGEAIRSLKERGKASTDAAEKQAINSEVQAAVNSLKQLKLKTAAIQEQYGSTHPGSVAARALGRPNVCQPNGPPALLKQLFVWST